MNKERLKEYIEKKKPSNVKLLVYYSETLLFTGNPYNGVNE